MCEDKQVQPVEQIPELGSPDLRYRYVCVCVLSLHIPPNCLIFRQERYEDRQLYYKPFCAFPTIPLFYYYCYSGAFTQKVISHISKHTLKDSTLIEEESFLKGDRARVNTHGRQKDKMAVGCTA